MSNISGFQRADTYDHSPLVYLAQTNNTTVTTNSRTQWDSVRINENGCWDSVNKWFVCPKAGRLFVGVTFIVDVPATTGLVVLAYDVDVQNSAGILYYRKRLAQGFGQTGFSAIAGFAVFDVNVGDRVFGVDYAGVSGCKLTGTDLAGVQPFQWDFANMTYYYLP